MKTGTCERTFDKWVKIKYPVSDKIIREILLVLSFCAFGY